MSTKSQPEWWVCHRVTIFRTIASIMAIMAVLKIVDEFRRLLLDSSDVGAVDLRHMHRWIEMWFSGAPLFQTSRAALYPPATYLMLWPLLGWMSFQAARWEWAVLFIAGLVVISLLSWRVVAAEGAPEKIFAALLILSVNGTGVAIGSGQFILIILPALMAAIFAIDAPENLGRDVVAAGLLTWAMVKPSIALPFIWIFFFHRNGGRLLLMVIVFYSSLTIASVAAQKESMATVIEAMFHRASAATTLFPGSRNLHALLVALGRPEWMMLASAIVFILLGIFIWLYRHADRWVLVGVTGLVARMWTYHRVYDDGLIVLAELALWRIARINSAGATRTGAEILLAVNAFVMLCPARFLDHSEYAWAPSWLWTCTSVQALVWILTLGFLIRYAQRNSTQSRAVSGGKEPEDVVNGASHHTGRHLLRQIIGLDRAQGALERP